MYAIEEEECTESTSQRVVEVLADVLDADPLTMTPLYDAIDPDALNSLLDTDATVEVQFIYEGHTVIVDSSGAVSVDGEFFAPER